MQEIRFGQFNRNVQNESVHMTQDSAVQSKNAPRKKFLRILVLIAIVLIVVSGFLYFWKIRDNFASFDPSASEYYAVFLTNGQVYFGKPLKKNRDNFVLTEVYYLQLSGSGEQAQDQLSEPKLNEPKFALVKLGNELHGPTDKLYINSSQILFYENLKNDSRVVQSIKNYRN